MEINIAESTFEVSSWMREFLYKKSKRLNKVSLGKSVKLIWRFEKTGGLFHTKLLTNLKDRQIRVSASSGKFKDSVDLVIEKMNREMTDNKDKKTNKIHRKAMRDQFIA